MRRMEAIISGQMQAGDGNAPPPLGVGKGDTTVLSNEDGGKVDSSNCYCLN